MAILDEIQANIRQLAEGAGPSVVGIGQRWGVGSGIVLADGRVLTNAHNVRGDQVTVTFADGRTADGSVAGQDIDGDLAVIEVDTGGERTFRGPRGRRITGSLEHTAPLLPGSSGGPVLSAGGELLGINTNRLGEGFYLAIPADNALRGRADALARGESATSPRLGVAIAPGYVARRLRRAVGLPETEGLLIREVMDDSPAARAGLAKGDLIVAAGGRPARTPDDLFDALQAAQGGTVELNIVRGTDERTVQVTFGEGGQPGQPGQEV
jgi:S1-C subfamily serine protease